MIARDNDIRSQLNEAARAHRTEAGEIGEEHLFGGTPVAVGDRVICRNNDARVGVDNGTRGTVRHVDGSCVVLDTTAELFASCRPATSPTMLSTRTA